MYPPQGIGGGGITKLSELTIDTQGYFKTDIATVITALNNTAIADAALYFLALLDEYIATVCDNANLTATKAASIFDNANLTVAKAASIFDNTNLTVAKAASIFDNANLTATKLQSILDNTNLTIQRGQTIVDAMATPSKIGTGGRRGVIGDDWQDNKITSRDKAATVATTFDKIFQNFRPGWTQVSGTTTCTGGQVVLDQTSEEINISTTFMVGTWELDFKFSEIGTGGTWYSFYLDFIAIDSSNSYYLLAAPDTDAGENWYRMYKRIASTDTAIIAGTWTPDINLHTSKVTRDGSGNFEIFLDGTSKGTVTNTEITSSSLLRLRKHANTASACYFDNLKIY
jgi:hypothetical protein